MELLSSGTGVVYGYASASSVPQGGTIKFHVSANFAAYDIQIFRAGVNGPQWLMTIPNLPGSSYSCGPIGVPAGQESVQLGCNWPVAYTLQVPSSWPSGIYVAQLLDQDDVPGKYGSYIPFVVTENQPGSTAEIVLMVPTTRWQAYNSYGGWSFYTDPPARRVTLARPYTKCDPRPLPNTNCAFRWQYPLTRWLENEGYAVELVTSEDVHADPGLLSHYRLLIIAGHDEYWTKEIRDHVDAFIDAGGNVAIFSGNTAYRQVRYQDNLRTLICYKTDWAQDPLYGVDNIRVATEFKRSPVPNWPQNSTTGLGWTGYVNYTPGSSLVGKYTVYRSGHWAFEGTGLSDGDSFWYEPTEKIEVDGTAFTWQNGLPVVTGASGTPSDFLILGLQQSTTGYAVMGLYTRSAGGTVFNTASMGWGRGLWPDMNPDGYVTVRAITRNVINHLLGGDLPPASTPTPTRTRTPTPTVTRTSGPSTSSPTPTQTRTPTPTATPTLAGGKGAFQESGGQVVMEAENYDSNVPRSSDTWTFRSDVAGYVAGGFMRAEPDNNSFVGTNLPTTSPELNYRVNFATTGTYKVWLRVYGGDASSDSIHVGLDGQEVAATTSISFGTRGSWVWAGGGTRQLTIAAAGLHTIHVWMREDGARVDRLLLTTNNSYTPTGDGPAESPRTGGTPNPTPTPSRTPTATGTASAIATPTRTTTASATPTGTSTLAVTPTPSCTPTATGAASATATPTRTATASATSTGTSTPTMTPTATAVSGGLTTLTLQIGASSDDVNQDGNTLSLTSPTIWLGNGSSTTASYTGLRFTNVTIPPGATITAAHVEVYANSTQWISMNMALAAEAVGNSSTFSTNNQPSQRTLTSAQVNHSSNVQWLAGTWYSLDDLTPVIQEVVNRGDWANGNSLSVILKGTNGSWGRKYVESYDGTTTNAPKLIITYTTPGGAAGGPALSHWSVPSARVVGNEPLALRR